ncbi:hypothetical protein C8F04DRAFT_1402719 [Mycena alexandri]|uniref:Uncharacterized protein n=1 Tax=Mycena alexandri TaxID=1745969 RepID=A0AAD6WSF0_9AGAR|nr:hypothetical protein C8F04DRAFT_1402719 [Mycena alexandri]
MRASNGGGNRTRTPQPKAALYVRATGRRIHGASPVDCTRSCVLTSTSTSTHPRMCALDDGGVPRRATPPLVLYTCTCAKNARTPAPHTSIRATGHTYALADLPLPYIYTTQKKKPTHLLQLHHQVALHRHPRWRGVADARDVTDLRGALASEFRGVGWWPQVGHAAVPALFEVDAEEESDAQQRLHLPQNRTAGSGPRRRAGRRADSAPPAAVARRPSLIMAVVGRRGAHGYGCVQSQGVPPSPSAAAGSAAG